MVLTSPFPESVIPEIPVGHYVVSSLERHGEAVAVVEVHSGREMTYKEILEETMRYVKLLRKAGLRKGDVVGLVLPFDMQYLPLFIAILYCGAVLFGCKLLFKSSIYNQLETVKPTLVVITNERLDELSEDLKTNVPSVKICLSFDQLQKIELGCLGSTENSLPSAKDFDVRKDPAIIYQSSGTTGDPKCIVTNHYGAVAAIVSPEKSKLVEFLVSSIIHVASLRWSFRSIIRGSKYVYASNITAEQLFGVIAKLKVNEVTTFKVSLLTGLVEQRQQCQTKCLWSSLKRIFVSGTTFPVELIRKARDVFDGVAVNQLYGTSETGIVATGFSNETPPDSVGNLSENVQVKIIERNSGKELEIGQKGEICVRSPPLLMRYLLKDGSVIEPLKKGWFYTGDLGYYDIKGNLYVAGRIKDIIKTQPNHILIVPAEFENVLLRHDKISDASVVRVSHADYGEAPKAFVVRNDDSLKKEDVIAFFESEVEHTMRLDGGVEFVETIPRTELGKPLRRQLLEGSLQNEV